MNPTKSVEDKIDIILSMFVGGIHGKGSEKGGYPSYFTEPYPIWFHKRKLHAKADLIRIIQEDVIKPDVEVLIDDCPLKFACDGNKCRYNHNELDHIHNQFKASQRSTLSTKE